ncbi:MAG: ATP-dependent zinc protease [Sphingomonadaceae bacterium]|nr:ATP-dependent zinc protease [Sphingomonadaceae bacterium]
MVTRRATGAHRLAGPVEIGWCELVDLPVLGLFDMRAKVDTGARTSSLHATRVRQFERDGAAWVRFVAARSVGHASRECEAPLVERRLVTSSTGHRQQRYVIKTRMALGPRAWEAQITLANRGTMAFPVLIGRRSLRRGFIVNSAKRWLLKAPATGGSAR